MAILVGVAGASGYVGGEILRLFSAHPEVEIGALTAHSSAGDLLGQHHAHLPNLAARILEPTTAAAFHGHDVVVLALPHGASAKLASELSDDTLVIDCGADYRLQSSADWQEYYGGDHAGTWPYGLPELIRDGIHQRANIVGVRRIAVPGCNVVATTLALQPAVVHNLIDVKDVVANLVVGYSGAGKKLAVSMLAAEAINNAQPYAVGGTHRHIPEILQNLWGAGASEDLRLSFTPVLAPMSRGILATVSAPVQPGTSASEAADVWREFYTDEPFVQVLPAGLWPQTAAVIGSNNVQVQVTIDEKSGRLIALAALDNLVKGTAGTALQAFNLAVGLPETTGLSVIGVAP